MIIWGWRSQIQQLAMLTLVCGYCRNPAAHALRATITKFTLFFIPLFTTSTRHEMQCTCCGAVSYVPPHHVNELLGRARQESAQTGHYGPGPGIPNPAPPNMAQPNASWSQQR
ncbi:zinc ribbon domain-containing protein [Nocardia callitridis]|uniref:Zinc-ribbon 15 domain-containing protein n=1 Tax=Nocardia callitridis TaxID=648753 RepID=A0ABP9KVG6_9NOCA